MATVTVEEAKFLTPGRVVSLVAKVLRTWQIGESHMCLVGDETGLVRLGLGSYQVQVERTYLFEGLEVRVYTGGWHSLELTPYSRVLATEHPVNVAADEKYIQQVYKILTGLERKRQKTGAEL